MQNENSHFSAKRCLVVLLFLSILFARATKAEQWRGPHPEVAGDYQHVFQNFQQYDVILEPDENAPEWWAGAPSVVRDESGTFWLACRMRRPDAPRGLRGYEIRLLRSDDGVHFQLAHVIPRDKVPIPGFERPALLIDPVTKRFKLYLCGPWQDGPWVILKLQDVAEPSHFAPSTARPVIQPPPRQYERDASVLEYKDPFVFYADGLFHCYTTGYIRRNERIFHFTSADGEEWQPVGDVNQPIMDLTGWHNFFVRPACVLPLGVGYLFVYEGSSTQWYDPVYNIATGFAFTFDLHHVTELTTDSPVAVSTTPGLFHTLRYSHWLWVDGDIWIYAEVARPNDSNEIRLFRMRVRP